MRDVTAGITLSCHRVIIHGHLSRTPMRNAEPRGKNSAQRHTAEGGFPVSGPVVANPGWFFPPHPGGLFQTVRLLIPRARDIIGNRAPALRKHAGELGRMWLKLWSAVADMLERNVGWTRHRLAIVHAKPDCSGLTWGHSLSLSCKRGLRVTQSRCWRLSLCHQDLKCQISSDYSSVDRLHLIVVVVNSFFFFLHVPVFFLWHTC